MVILVGLAIFSAIAVSFWLLFSMGNSRRRATGNDLMELRPAESKVKVSDPILRVDIDILERHGSELLDDAIALRRAQLQRGEPPDSQRSE